MIARYNGDPTVGIGHPQAERRQHRRDRGRGGNAPRRRREGAADAASKMYDATGFIDFSKGVREAVAETEFALVFGALLAVFTVWVFLRRSRPTFIIALPSRCR